MLNACFDHLWQSLLFCLLVGGCAFMTRAACAVFRLWLWRAAALKFLFPFAWLFGLGEWCGYPVAYSADPAPPMLVAWIDAAAPWLAPAHTAKLPGLFVASVLLTSAFSIRWIIARVRVEQRRTRAELARQEIDPDDKLRYPGFFASELMTTCAIMIVTVPLLAGAATDERRRDELLIANSQALRFAPLVMTESPPGQGFRYHIVADAHGVLIRNANLVDLVSIVYGITRYSVWSEQMTTDDPEKSPFVYPRYDVRITGPVRSPEEFDPYALRRPVTKLLAERFGLEIELDGKCQPPCGIYGVPMSDDPL